VKDIYAKYRIIKYSVGVAIMVPVIYVGNRLYVNYNRIAFYPSVQDAVNNTPYNFKGVIIYAPAEVIERVHYYFYLWGWLVLLLLLLGIFNLMALRCIIPRLDVKNGSKDNLVEKVNERE
jgi:hypothetical protein